MKLIRLAVLALAFLAPTTSTHALADDKPAAEAGEAKEAKKAKKTKKVKKAAPKEGDKAGEGEDKKEAK